MKHRFRMPQTLSEGSDWSNDFVCLGQSSQCREVVQSMEQRFRMPQKPSEADQSLEFEQRFRMPQKPSVAVQSLEFRSD